MFNIYTHITKAKLPFNHIIAPPLDDTVNPMNSPTHLTSNIYNCLIDGLLQTSFNLTDPNPTTTNMGFGWVKQNNNSPSHTFHGNTTFIPIIY
ncbi:unnamed protein product [Rhizophagus irregularis]|nr:unnamed protein product [Rhizophagus irregularis]CAB5393507.1 unnamed protein product [Rhizophagus irregularis]